MGLTEVDEFKRGVEKSPLFKKKDYVYKFNKFLELTEATSVKDMGADEINTLFTQLYFQGLASVPYIIGMSMSLRYYFKEVLGETEKAKEIKYPAYNFNYLNDEEVAQIYEVSRKIGGREFIITRLMLHYGFDYGKIIGIKLPHIEYKGEKMSILYPGNEHFLLRLEDEEKKVIKKLIKKTFKEGEAGYLFKGLKGGPRSLRSMQHIVADIKKEAGLMMRNTEKAFIDTFLINSLINGASIAALKKRGFNELELVGYFQYIKKKKLEK